MKIVRLITRLNVGGPAQQAIFLSDPKAHRDWTTHLVVGRPDPSEGSMEYLLRDRACSLIRIPALGREVNPLRDLQAGFQILRTLLKERPEILHTHTAKAGALGRFAGWIYRRMTRKPLKMIHTFHGHVFQGYFGRLKTSVFIQMERWLAQRSECLIAINESVRQDLLRLRLAPVSKIRLIPLGLPLESLLAIPPASAHPNQVRVGLIGRMVPIKNHELLLKAARLLQEKALSKEIQFLLIGDGQRRKALEQMARQMHLQQSVRFMGWQSDLPQTYQALDLVCLTSKNEGTPLAAIEALAAARPVVSTDVGGVRQLLGNGENLPAARTIPKGTFEVLKHGILIPPEDDEALSRALRFLIDQPQVGLQLGQNGRRFVQAQFSMERLVRNLDRLYQELLVP